MSEDDDAGARVADLSRVEFYELVRSAFKDALLDVVGTLLLVGVGLVLTWAGLSGAVAAATGESPAFAVVGVAVALAGVYVLAAALEYVPPLGDVVGPD